MDQTIPDSRETHRGKPAAIESAHRATVMTAPSNDERRRGIRTRLSEGSLGSVCGVSRSGRGTGQPCVVCSSAIEPAEVEREVHGGGVFLYAHESCYGLWLEESVARRAATGPSLEWERARRRQTLVQGAPSMYQERRGRYEIGPA
jgi:hypothetical protein